MTAEHPKPDTGRLAEQRTFLAAERTLFAALRTGLSIAGGGSLVITLLGDSWPTWVQVPLVVTFLIVGYGMTYSGLGRYRRVLDEIGQHRPDRDAWLRNLTIGLAVLQATIVVVVVLFLFELFGG